jgi:hypothetical protein
MPGTFRSVEAARRRTHIYWLLLPDSDSKTCRQLFSWLKKRASLYGLLLRCQGVPPTPRATLTFVTIEASGLISRSSRINELIFRSPQRHGFIMSSSTSQRDSCPEESVSDHVLPEIILLCFNIIDDELVIPLVAANTSAPQKPSTSAIPKASPGTVGRLTPARTTTESCPEVIGIGISAFREHVKARDPLVVVL